MATKKNPSLLIRGAFITLDELITSLGVAQTLKVLSKLAKINAAGGAFAGLPPTDQRMQDSRDQIALAVNLYQALLSVTDETRAYKLTRRIVLLSSVMLLRSVYPSFEGGDFTKLVKDGDPRKASARLAQEFPFADTEPQEMTKETAGFDVTLCRIPLVLKEIGCERLAPIFCEVDAIYFPIYAPEVVMSRTETLVHGGNRCDFRFRYRT